MNTMKILGLDRHAMPDNQVDSQIAARPGMNNPGRRDFLTAAPAALVTAVLASTPAASQDLSKAAAAQKDGSVTDPGPENTQIRDANPNTFLPPVTDHGEVQTFWSSFSAAHRRIQEGGWSRQVTVEDFPISKDINFFHKNEHVHQHAEPTIRTWSFWTSSWYHQQAQNQRCQV